MKTNRAAAVITTRPCGFCSTGFHDRCPGAIQNKGNELWFCPCGCPQSKLVRCKECGHAEADELTGWHCADSLQCAVRRQKRREGTTIYRFIQEMEQAKMAADNKPTPQPQAKKATAPKEGKCRCCGDLTKGGAYLPGHDARHVSQVAQRVKEGAISAEDALVVFADKPKLQDKLRKRLES